MEETFDDFVYLFENPTLEKSNHFDHKRKLTKDWYEGTTAFTFINDIINKCLNYEKHCIYKQRSIRI